MSLAEVDVAGGGAGDEHVGWAVSEGLRDEVVAQVLDGVDRFVLSGVGVDRDADQFGVAAVVDLGLDGRAVGASRSVADAVSSSTEADELVRVAWICGGEDVLVLSRDR